MDEIQRRPWMACRQGACSNLCHLRCQCSFLRERLFAGRPEAGRRNCCSDRGFLSPGSRREGVWGRALDIKSNGWLDLLSSAFWFFDRSF